jgi:peroxiredoxin
MKQYVQRALAITAVSFLIACNEGKKEKFEVTGHIKNATAQTVYLEETSLINFQPLIVDSANLNKDGSFQLKAMPKEETVYSLRLSNSRLPLLSLINDSKKVTVEADANSQQAYTYDVKGSEASSKLKEYFTTSSNKVQQIMELLSQDKFEKSKTSDSLAAAMQLDKENRSNEFKNYASNFISGSNHPALALYVLGAYQTVTNQYNLKPFTDAEVTSIIDAIGTKFPKHESVAAIKNIVKPKAAPNFTLPDTSGKPVSLSSFKGKYVLVDFWASWCKPCRMENPNVVKAYNQYKDKNFTVLGVSLDKDKNAWVDAIKQDSLTWTHVSDLQYWNSAVVPLYGFDGIPYNVLLDPNGIIIGRGLRGEDLENKLKEVLK